jgi:hypothetical protein
MRSVAVTGAERYGGTTVESPDFAKLRCELRAASYEERRRYNWLGVVFLWCFCGVRVCADGSSASGPAAACSGGRRCVNSLQAFKPSSHGELRMILF